MNEFSFFTLSNYAIIFWLSFFGWFVFEGWVGIIREWRMKTGIKNADRGSRAGITVALYGGLFFAFISVFTLPFFRIQNSLIAFIIGIVLIWVGIALRFWAIQTLGKYFVTVVVIQNGHTIITSGPYRYIRHPAYTGPLITVLGVGLALGNWMSVIILIGTLLLAYLWRIRVEEAALREGFGETYEQYAKKTWALIPLIW